MTGPKISFTEVIEWHELGKRQPVDDDETLLVQYADGAVWPAYLDAGEWCGLDAMPCKTPVRWAHWPRGRA